MARTPVSKGPKSKTGSQLHSWLCSTNESVKLRKNYKVVKHLGFIIKVYPQLSDFGYGPYCSVETASGVQVFGRSGLEAVKAQIEEYIRRNYVRRKVRLPNGYYRETRSIARNQ